MHTWEAYNRTMNRYEEELQIAYDLGCAVHEGWYLGDGELKGLYMDGHIALGRQLDTTAEKACVLAEEIGHHNTTTGNILDQNSVDARKQERKARLEAYYYLGIIPGLVSAYEAACRNRFEVAEHIGITEAVLEEALLIFADKYPDGLKIEQYLLYFDPLVIMKRR